MSRALYQRRIAALRKIISRSRPPTRSRVKALLSWLATLRNAHRERTTRVPLTKLPDWVFDQTRGIVRHKAGKNKFFTVEGLIVERALGREVTTWNQPILIQKEGGVLAIFCQKQHGQMKFLLQARFEPGNIHAIQLAHSLQATFSNLMRHHRGTEPPLAEWLTHPSTTCVYKARHNEEGARFFRKSNTNILMLIDPTVQLPLPDDTHYRWFTMPEIQTLMLFDHVINPYVKTILAPL